MRSYLTTDSPELHTSERQFRCWFSQQLASFVAMLSRLGLSLRSLRAAGRRYIILGEWLHELEGLPVLGVEHKKLRSSAEKKVFSAPHAPNSSDAVPSSRSVDDASWQASVSHGDDRAQQTTFRCRGVSHYRSFGGLRVGEMLENSSPAARPVLDSVVT